MTGDVDTNVVNLDVVRRLVENAAEWRGEAARESAGHAPEPFSDDDAAVFCREALEGRYLYNSRQNLDLFWNGNNFEEDEKRTIDHTLRLLLREYSSKADTARTKQRLGSGAAVQTVKTLLRADPKVAVKVDDLDADAELLATPGAYYEVTTGRRLEPDPRYRITKATTVAPGGECPTFDRCMREWTLGDIELELYIRRFLAYCLTGLTKEQIFFFIYGPGGNGKSVLMNVVSRILGPYAKHAPMGLFCVSRGERHPTEWADLVGARLVVASETENGRRLDAAAVKSFTGGEPITARRVRENNFSYVPQAKLVLLGNYKPQLGSVDQGMRRRARIIPFMYQPETTNPNLEAALMDEAPGILAALLSLGPQIRTARFVTPGVVQHETDEYLDVQDTLGEWLEECTERSPGAFSTTSDLYQSYAAFAQRTGEHPGKEKTFVGLLQGRGFVRGKSSDGRRRGIVGLVLRTAQGDMGFGRAGDVPADLVSSPEWRQ